VTLADAIARAARTSHGVTHVRGDGHDDHQTYAELQQEARQILTGLRAAGGRPARKSFCSWATRAISCRCSGAVSSAGSCLRRSALRRAQNERDAEQAVPCLGTPRPAADRHDRGAGSGHPCARDQRRLGCRDGRIAARSRRRRPSVRERRRRCRVAAPDVGEHRRAEGGDAVASGAAVALARVLQRDGFAPPISH
jgi:hypothetical protein